MNLGSRSLSRLSGASLLTLLVATAVRAEEAPPPTPPPNRPPVIADAALTLDEDSKGTGALRASDPDGDALRFQIAHAPARGEVALDAEKGTFEYTPQPDVHGEDAFIVEVSDGELRASANVKVLVRPENDPPVATGATLSLDEDAQASGVFAVSDIEGDRLYFAIAREPRSGKVVITDAQKGAFAYTPKRDFHGDDAFVFEVGDGKLAARAEIQLRVAPVNDAPSVEGGAHRTREEQPVEVQVAARDVEGDALTFSVARPPAHGSVEVLDDKTGRFQYRPEKDFHGDDRFTVAVSDGKATANAELVMSVTPVNDPPVASLLTLSLEEDGKGEGVLTASDVDGDTLNYRVVRAPAQGEASIDGASGRVSYRPRPNVFGADAFTVEVSDGAARVPVEVRVEIAARNDAPESSDLALTTAEDAPVSGQVVASDIDGDALTYALAQRPAHGEATVDRESGAVRYVPRADFFGEDAFRVDVSDGQAQARANVRVSVTPVNDPPVVPALALSGEEDAVVSGALAARDVEGDALRFRLLTRPRHGDAVVDEATGAVRFTPPKDWHGADAFTVEVSDGSARVQGEVKVTVAPRNDAPVARDLALKTAEDTSARGRITASDVDGDKLRYRLVSPPGMGTVKIEEETGALEYTPAADQSGADAFVVEVSDGQASARARVEVEVLRVPDPPRVGEARFTTREDEAVSVRIPASDPDGDKLSFRLLSTPRRGEVALEDAALGRLRYVPRADENGEDSLEVEVSDGRHRVTATVHFTIAPVNDAPTVGGLTLTTDEDHPVSGRLTGADIDGDRLVFRVHTPPKKGTVIFDEADPRRFVFEPALNQEGADRFEVVAFDGKATSAPATVEVSIRGVNDVPVIARGQRVTTQEDVAVTGTLRADDGDGEPLRYRILRQPARGRVKLDDATTGRFTFTPNLDVFGNDSFSFEVSDPHGASAADLVRVTVEEVNDPPVAMREYADAPRYGRVTRKLKGFDPEGKPVSFRIVRQPQIGRVELRDPSSGEYVFITDGSASGTVEVEFVVNDGEHDSLPAAVVVRVR